MKFFFLCGLLIVALVAIVLVYRHSTQHTRLAPKKELARKCVALQTEVGESNRLLEKLVDTANLWKSDSPVLADDIIIQITNYKREQEARMKELSK